MKPKKKMQKRKNKKTFRYILDKSIVRNGGFELESAN